MGIVRLVASVAKHSARVFRGRHLGKVRGLGGVLLVTARAEGGDVRQRGFDGDAIGGVRRLGSVTGLAGDMGVLSQGARLCLIIVTGDALGLAAERDWPLTNHF